MNSGTSFVSTAIILIFSLAGPATKKESANQHHSHFTTGYWRSSLIFSRSSFLAINPWSLRQPDMETGHPKELCYGMSLMGSKTFPLEATWYQIICGYGLPVFLHVTKGSTDRLRDRGSWSQNEAGKLGSWDRDAAQCWKCLCSAMVAQHSEVSLWLSTYASVRGVWSFFGKCPR